MRGGLLLNAHKEHSTALSIATTSIPKQLFYVAPADAQLLVAIDQRIQLGQPLLRHGTLAQHSSVSGIVNRIESRDTITLVIDSDNRDDPHSSLRAIVRFDALSPSDLRTHIVNAGIAGLGGAMFSTATKLEAAAHKQATVLIVNGAECEPYISCDAALMQEMANDVVLGTQALLHASGATEAFIAIEDDKPQAIAAINDCLARLEQSNIRVHSLAKFYPTGGERQLVKLITEKEVPTGGIPPDVGVLCQNVGTAAAIARLIRTGEPLIQRVVTIAGGGIKQPRNLMTRLGTPIATLIAECGGYCGQVERLVMGGPMMGVALADDTVPVTGATNCIIAATAEDLRPRNTEMPCIRCGDCAHACPAALLPQQLLRYARLNDRAALRELGLSDCIECGCCDYVCPSQIPLASLFIAAKNLS